jgi:hypothetical protein
VLAAIRWRDGRSWAPLAFGAAIGASIQFRTDSILLLGLAFAALPFVVAPKRLLADRRGFVLAAIPVALSMVLLAWYDVLRFGTPLPQYSGTTFSTPLLTGLTGLLVSPGKGLFVYAPVLLLGIVGMVPLFRRDRGVFVLIAVLAAVRPLFYAKWAIWHGGVGWGPRFLLPLCVLLIVPAAEAVRADRHWRRVMPWRVLGAVFAVVGVALSLLSVSMPYEQWWAVLNAEGTVAGPEVLANRVHGYYWGLADTHIAGNLHLLLTGNAWPAAFWWTEGRLPVGVFSLTVGLVALWGALRVGRSRPAGPHEMPSGHDHGQAVELQPSVSPSGAPETGVRMP